MYIFKLRTLHANRLGFEESTFNLADLVRYQREARDEDDESGIGHAEVRNIMSPQPGQSDDTLSDKVGMCESALQQEGPSM